MQLRELFAKVGSYYPVRESFRLTPEVKAGFTEKLKSDRTELSGRKVMKVVRAGVGSRSEEDMEHLRIAARKFVYRTGEIPG